MSDVEQTLFGAAVREFHLLLDGGRDLPDELVGECQSVMSDLLVGTETPDIVQTIRTPTDGGGIALMVCPGWRLIAAIVRLRKRRTFH